MSKKEITQKVIALVVKQFPGVGDNTIQRDTSFYADLNADSLDQIELIMECEEVFDINIPDEDAEAVRTVGEMIDYIAKRRKSNAT